jgi:hypothetical protein
MLKLNLRKLQEQLSDWGGSCLYILGYALLIYTLWLNANTTGNFKAECLAEGGEFTKGHVLFFPIQTCTYLKSTKA